MIAELLCLVVLLAAAAALEEFFNARRERSAPQRDWMGDRSGASFGPTD